MSQVYFESVSIIGVGLLGASLGLALKHKGLTRHIVGVGRRVESLEIALDHGAVDRITLSLEQGVTEADFVVLATPAGQVRILLEMVLKSAKRNPIIIDLASTKRAICEHARHMCPLPRRFIGCHPMAGGELSGPEHGRADLFANTVCLVEHDDTIDPHARAYVCALWERIGAVVRDMNPETHDAILAGTSHAPHVIAAILALVAAERGANAFMIGNGFRDATRIAASRPELWRDICLENSQAIATVLAAIRERIEVFETLLRHADGQAIERFFIQGAEARRKVLDS